MAPQLTAPAERAAASFLAANMELRAEGRTPGGTVDADDGWFARYLDVLRRDVEDPEPGRVPQTTLWWCDGDAFLGRLSIRHRLTPALRRHGGHIGYDVRPSARRRGHATAMLRAALPLAAGLGIEHALVTCDPGNVASRKVIEAAGGIRLDEPGPELRFWVPTCPR
ncbi:GNAT family N-acetyltransferase [Pseudonocardia sp.]|uniref:GNAT family N-acetyltransferase n=1 Tax=Pseudonocardia sp. TaxID=60912 RepID=UPI003D0C905E